MRRFLFALLFIVCLQSQADAGVVIGSGVVSECPGKLVCQNFETITTGFDNSETWTTSGIGVNPAYTTTPVRGSQSLYLSDSTSYAKITFTSKGELWGHQLISCTDGQPANALRLVSLNANTTLVGMARINTSGYLEVFAGGSVIASIVNALPNNQTGVYHFWWHWKKGTGANAIFEGSINQSTTRPATYDVTQSGGSATENADNYQATLNNPGGMWIDQILINDSDLFSTVQP